jgi:DNA-binding MarR family transcriptional regulator
MSMSIENLYNLAERLGELLRVERRGMLRAKQLEPVHLATLCYMCTCNRFSNSASAITEYLGQTKGTTSQTLKVLEKNRF